MTTFDIDIDFKTDFDPTKIMEQAVPASRVHKQELVKHPCGHYFQSIPIDQCTGLAAIPYEEAENIGYFKIDFLHLSLLNNLTSKQQIRELIEIEPDWNLLLHQRHVEKLFQIHRNYELLYKLRPKSVQELADCIALIRPGKKHLVDQYLDNKETVRKQLYTKSTDGYYFKKGHAISYALTIVVQLHLIKQGTI